MSESYEYDEYNDDLRGCRGILVAIALSVALVAGCVIAILVAEALR